MGFFWNANEKSLRESTLSAASVLARLMRDRVENMSGEMKLTPAAHPTSHTRRSPPLPQLDRRLFGTEEGTLLLAAGRVTILSLYFQPL